jgi:predicted phage tail protein
VVNLVYLQHFREVFNLENNTKKQVNFTPGKTVFQYIQDVCLDNPDNFKVLLNAEELKTEDLNRVPDNESSIIFVSVPQGGGGNGEGDQIGQIVLAIIIMWFAGWAGGAVTEVTGGAAAAGAGATATGATAWNFWGWAAAIGVQVAGGMLINKWFPPAKPDQKTISPSYDWGGPRTSYGQGNPTALNFGTVGAGGQVIGKYTTTDGENEYLNLLIEAGEGPCDYIGDGENDNCTGIAKIKINNNPVESYSGVKVFKRAGLNDQSVIPNFNDTINEQGLNYELKPDGAWHIQTTQGATGSGIEIRFDLPRGLYWINNKGSTHSNWVSIKVQYKLHDAVDWIDWQEFWEEDTPIYSDPEDNNPSGYEHSEGYRDFLISGVYTRPINRIYRKDNLPIGQYDVRCQCTGMERADSNDAYQTYWTKLSHIITDDFSYPNKNLVSLNAVANGQLNGNLPNVTFETTKSNVLVWVPDDPILDPWGAGSYQEKPANNPAWAAYWLLHRVHKLKNINTGEFEYLVKGIPTSRLLYSEFLRWADFCTSRQLEVNIRFDTFQRLRDALKPIEEMGRGTVIPRATKYGCIFDAPADKDINGNIIPAQVFNVSNISKDSFSEQFVNISDRATSIEVTFFNKEKGYERDMVRVPADGLTEAQAAANPAQITLYGCTSLAQAWREGKYRLRLTRYLNCSAAWKTSVNALASEIGQVVMVQHDVSTWGIGGYVLEADLNSITLHKKVTIEEGKSYQVQIWSSDDTQQIRNVTNLPGETDALTVDVPFENVPLVNDLWNFGEPNKYSKPFKITEIKRTADLEFTLVGLEYIDEIYTEAEDVPEVNYAILEPTFEVTDLKAIEETFKQRDGTIISRLNCSWSWPRNKQPDNHVIFYSTDEKKTWTLAGYTKEKYFYIDNVKTEITYYVKISTVNDVIVSAGTISTAVTITGKDIPPGDVVTFNITQSGSKLNVSITPPDDPDLDYFEIRFGPTWTNSAPIRVFKDIQTSFDAPQEGTQTFWVKAFDYSGNQSNNAKKAVITITGLKPKNIVFTRVEDPSTWDAVGMFRTAGSGCWALNSVETFGDLTYFADMFNTPLHFRTDASLILPPIDLGPNVIEENYFFIDPWGDVQLRSAKPDGTPKSLADYTNYWDIFSIPLVKVTPQYKIETFLNIDVDYQKSEFNYVNIEFRTSLDGVTWGSWTPLINHQFFGRWVQLKFLPGSLDNVTNVNICGATIKIDVPDLTENIAETAVSNSGSTRYYLNQRFFAAPLIKLYSYDSGNKQCTHEIVDGTSKYEETLKKWYFEVRLWDGITQIAGKVYGEAEGY